MYSVNIGPRPFLNPKNMDKIINYFVSAWGELKKVSWPTKNQTINYSLLVIGLSVGFAVFFSALDYGLNFGFAYLLSLK